MANSFAPKDSIPLKPKAAPEPEVVQAATPAPGGLTLPTPKPRRKQYSVYLDVDSMEWAKRIAQQQGITIGNILEACINAARKQMEG